MERLTTVNGDCLDSIGKPCRVSNSCPKKCLKHQLILTLKRLSEYENAGTVPLEPKYIEQTVCLPGQYAWIFRRKRGRPESGKGCNQDYVLDHGQVKSVQYTADGRLLVSVSGKGAGALNERVFLTREDAEKHWYQGGSV